MIRATNASAELQWTLTGPQTYQSCGQTLLPLPAGAYSCRLDCYGKPVFHRRKLAVDELVDFSGSLAHQVLEEVNRFWTLEDRFAQLGFLHRRGYLFFGKQGGGKSSLIHQILAPVIQGGDVAFFCENPFQFEKCVTEFRQVEPFRPMVCVFEDIDALIEEYGDQQLLQWLDGNVQVDKVVNLATTNYPQKLDPRIVARPRRFDRVLRIESPDEGLRAAYLRGKLPDQSDEERAHWVRTTHGLTFAALAELVVSVECFGHGLEETVERLRALDERTDLTLEEAATG